MPKIVYNGCYGGFGLSDDAFRAYCERGGTARSYYDIDRTDPILVQIVEEFGEKADNRFSRLLIRELPAGTKYRIDEYDGMESVMTIDDYDWKIA